MHVKLAPIDDCLGFWSGYSTLDFRISQLVRLLRRVYPTRPCSSRTFSLHHVDNHHRAARLPFVQGNRFRSTLQPPRGVGPHYRCSGFVAKMITNRGSWMAFCEFDPDWNLKHEEAHEAHRLLFSSPHPHLLNVQFLSLLCASTPFLLSSVASACLVGCIPLRTWK